MFLRFWTYENKVDLDFTDDMLSKIDLSETSYTVHTCPTLYQIRHFQYSENEVSHKEDDCKENDQLLYDKAFAKSTQADPINLIRSFDVKTAEFILGSIEVRNNWEFLNYDQQLTSIHAQALKENPNLSEFMEKITLLGFEDDGFITEMFLCSGTNKSTEDEFDQPQSFKSQSFLPNQILPKLFSFRISIYHYQDLKRILN